MIAGPLLIMSGALFLPYINLHRAACKVEVLPQPVLEESFVRVLHVLGKVAEESE